MNNKENLIKKWSAILENQEKNDQTKQTECNTLVSDISDNSFPSNIPIAMRVASKTIRMDLVGLNPMGVNITDEMVREVNAENRDRKIDSITKDKKYQEMKIEEHPDYNRPPKGKLFYLDFQYGSSQSNLDI